VRAGLHDCVIVIVSYRSERVVCKVAYWERCVILLTCESVAEEIFTLRVSVILSPEGAVEVPLWYINTRLYHSEISTAPSGLNITDTRDVKISSATDSCVSKITHLSQ